MKINFALIVSVASFFLAMQNKVTIVQGTFNKDKIKKVGLLDVQDERGKIIQ